MTWRWGQPGRFAQPRLGGAGLLRGEQRVGFFQRGERVAVPVGVDHVQVLAGLIPGPVAHQVIGHLGHPGFERGGEPAAAVDHPEAVPIGGDPQRDQHAVDRDGLHELRVEVQVAADIAGWAASG